MAIEGVPNGVTPVLAPVAAPPPAPAQADLAALAAKERDFVKRQQAFTAERDAFQKERETLLAAKQRADSFIEGAKRQPSAIAKQLWGEEWYEKLTDLRLNGDKLTPDLVAASVEDRLNAWEQKRKDEQAARETTEREQLVAQRQQIIDDFRQQATEFVKGAPDEYEMVNLHGAHSEVYRTIETHYEKQIKDGSHSPKILSFKEAADLVEKDLRDRVEKSLSAKAFKDKYAAKAPPQPQGEVKREGSSAQPRTLTPAFTATSTPGSEVHPEGASLLSEEERIRRAIAVGEAVRKSRAQ